MGSVVFKREEKVFGEDFKLETANFQETFLCAKGPVCDRAGCDIEQGVT